MTIIRRGITRTVILTRRHAIKIPSLRPYGNGLAGLLWSICRGILANQSEAEWWRNSSLEQREYLCPVQHSWLGGVVNIYPRCSTYEPGELIARQMSDREFYPLPGMSPPLGDNKPDNYGWLCEPEPDRYGYRLVVLDYDMNWNGCPHDRSGARNRIEQDLRDEAEAL